MTTTSEPSEGQRRWNTGWRRHLFPAVWLVYLVQTVSGVHRYSDGAWEVLGYVLLAGFAAGYLLALPAGWSGDVVRFRTSFAVLVVLSVALIPLARSDAFVTWVFVVVLVVAGFRRHALWIMAVATAVAVVLPALVPSWHEGLDWDMLLTIPMVGLAMYGFFAIIEANQALREARIEVARLAAENERTRIARDLHDLLGHSLTTITVKAGLARKLAELETAGGADSRTAQEIGEVEQVARRSLTEVRAAVSGFHEVSLAGEVATARAVLHAAAIGCESPRALDVVDPARSELFGWVVREGVTNVVRHARATRCVIDVGSDWVEVSDDGFGVAQLGSLGPARTDGNGLPGLRDRVETAGGTLVCGRTPTGWRVRAELPAHVAVAPRVTV